MVEKSHSPEDHRVRHLSGFGLALVATGLLLTTVRADAAAVRKAVTFYASFDETVAGDFSKGDLKPGMRYPNRVRSANCRSRDSTWWAMAL